MFHKYFSFMYFLIALAIGLLYVYLDEPNENIIYVYPTPDNINNIEYKDIAENCFTFKANNLECPLDRSLIKTIPIQSNKER